MAQEYRFNSATGTMEPVSQSASKTIGVVSKQVNTKFQTIEEVKNDSKSVVPMQSISMEEMPGEPEVVFKERSQLSVVQIVDQDTGKLLCYISGYGLDISFNIKELKSTKKIEQCLDGLSTMFRKIIMDQIVGKEE